MPRIASVKDKGVKPQVGLYSFSSTSKSTSGQFEFDVTSFRDPAGQKQFAAMNGTFPEVREWMKEDRRVKVIFEECLLLADDLLKEKVLVDKTVPSVSSWLSLAFKDFHGKWTAPAIAELVADVMSDAGYVVVVYHTSLPQEAVWAPPPTL